MYTPESFKERLHREVQLILVNKTADSIIERIEEQEKYWMKQMLKLFGDTLSMEFLPKKVILIEKKQKRFKPKEIKTKYIFLGRKPTVQKIEYKADVIYSLLKQADLNFDFNIVKKYCLAKDVQKKRKNKYFYLDRYR